MSYRKRTLRGRGLGWLLLLSVLARPAWAQGHLDYGAWQLELAEEFDRSTDTVALGRHWQFAYPWGRTLHAPEAQYYSATEVRADSGGVLRLMAHTAAQPIQYRGRTLRYTAGMLMSHYRNPQMVPADCPSDDDFGFGLFEIRCRQPRDPNAFPAFWLYGGGPPDEMDIFEASPFHFGNTFTTGPNGYWRPTRRQSESCSCYFYENQDPAGNLHQQYHTYSLSWLPNEAVLYFDGVPIRHETRLLPTGCAMRLIVNLAMWDWSRARTDALVVDYIRVYRPRQPLRPAAGQRPGAEAPASELAWLPAERPPGRLDQGMFQRWQLAPAARAGQPLGLELTDNYNPTCDLTLPLPVAGHWAPAWVQTAGTPELRVSLLSGADSLHWAVADPLGRLVQRGAVPGGQPLWRPSWPDLPPGAYVLHLGQGPSRRTHPLQVVGRPAGSAPVPDWQSAPPTPAASTRLAPK